MEILKDGECRRKIWDERRRTHKLLVKKKKRLHSPFGFSRAYALTRFKINQYDHFYYFNYNKIFFLARKLFPLSHATQSSTNPPLFSIIFLGISH